MEKIDWGHGWNVSKLCFGVLPIGPAGKNVPPAEAGGILLEAFRLGVNFIDTAQSYRTYPHIRHALDRHMGEKIYVATKSGAESYEKMEEAVVEAQEELGLEHIDIFHLHAARVQPDVFEKRRGALECLEDYKARGIVGRVGISTHSATVVARAAAEDAIEVVFPLINRTGHGVLDGDRDDMIRAIERVHEAGKPMYAMKAFAGGNLLEDRRGALDFVTSLRGIDVVAVGMVNVKELLVNTALLEGSEVDEKLWEETARNNKQMFIAPFCAGCGTCLDHCPNDALYLEDGKCKIRREQCILCGYCAPDCPQFAIRMV